MQGYVVSRPVTVRSASQIKHIRAAASFERPAVDEVQINASNEATQVLAQLRRDWPDLPTQALFRSVPHTALTEWPHFPAVLGRQASGVDGVGSVLAGQLQALRARHPQRQHFRLLFNNGFGSNLGDTLVGLTAFRAVWPVLKAHLPEVSVDVLVGWSPRGAVARLLQQCEGIEAVLHQGPTLQGLARYQGLFDLSELLILPRYGTMPPVDWYLWWMGLDPTAVDDLAKRNRIALDPEAMAVVAKRLGAASGPRILINPMASEPLRRMPLAAVRRVAQAVLNVDPTAQVVFDQPVDFANPRVLSLADMIDSPERLAALVAQVDGVITPDTFLQHVADATATPTCTLSASVPAAFYRYYPLGPTLVLPGAEGLAGWGRTKVDEARWEDMKAAYFEAWAQLDPVLVLATLAQAREAKARAHPATKARIDPPRAPFRVIASRSAQGEAPLVPLRQRKDPEADALQRALLQLAGDRLVPGDTVALLGAGAGALAVALAQRVAPAGRVVAFEPRRLIHQILCANLVDAGCDGVETYPAMPVGRGFGQILLPRLAPQDEHVASAASNQLVREPVLRWPLDLLELPQCRLIVLQTPVPLVAALQGTLKTVARVRPTLVAGGVRAGEVAVWQDTLQGLGYTLRLHSLAEGGETLADLSVLVAEPDPPVQ